MMCSLEDERPWICDHQLQDVIQAHRQRRYQRQTNTESLVVSNINEGAHDDIPFHISQPGDDGQQRGQP